MGNGKVVEDDELDDGIVIDDNGGEGLTFKRLTGAASAALTVAEGAAEAALRSCKRAAEAALDTWVTLTRAVFGVALMTFAALIISNRNLRSSANGP